MDGKKKWGKTTYSEKFMNEVVAQMLEPYCNPVTETAEAYNVPYSTIHSWRRRALQREHPTKTLDEIKHTEFLLGEKHRLNKQKAITKVPLLKEVHKQNQISPDKRDHKEMKLFYMPETKLNKIGLTVNCITLGLVLKLLWEVM